MVTNKELFNALRIIIDRVDERRMHRHNGHGRIGHPEVEAHTPKCAHAKVTETIRTTHEPKCAHARANKELAEKAARHNMSVEEFKAAVEANRGGKHCCGRHAEGHGAKGKGHCGRHTLPRERVLAFIFEKGAAIRQKDLADGVGIRPSSLSEAIDKLELDGYVTKTVDETDKRVTLISLTEKGENRAKEVVEAHEKRMDALFKDLSDSERETLMTLLAKIGK